MQPSHAAVDADYGAIMGFMSGVQMVSGLARMGMGNRGTLGYIPLHDGCTACRPKIGQIREHLWRWKEHAGWW